MATRRGDLAAPRQQRSRATRERILEALPRLLERATFDQIGVAEVTTAAGCSISSFYARFPTKDALLDAFLDRFFERSAGMVSTALAQIAAVKVTRRARRLVELILRSYRDHRGLLRSLILHDRTHPSSSFGNRTRAHKKELSVAFLALLIGEDAGAAKPPLAASARFGLWLVIQAAEQIVLFDDPILGRGKASQRRAVEHLTAVLLRTFQPPA